MSGSPDFPLIVTPGAGDNELAAWVTARPGWTAQPLGQHGAILFRGFQVDGVADFRRVVGLVSPALLAYTERSTPRTGVGHDIYTSTEYPAHLDIVQHNENSYASTWPRTIAFYCARPADRGGETPLGDSAEVYRQLPPSTRDRFASKGVMYVRNYGLGVDLSWQDAYQTDDPAAVEAYCRGASIAFEWLDGHRRLRTRQVRPAVARHPVTDDWLWFNQAHLFHTSSLDPATREALHGMFADEDLPRQAYFGDGCPIPASLLDEVRETYRAVLRTFPWQIGDVLLVDNMRISHGRRAFTGPRQVFVAMADPWDKTE
jgi:alpha-ketoglutarate-dependent taurine dioxygenase